MRLLARKCQLFADADLAVVDPDIVSAFRIVTNPGLVSDRSSISAVIRQGQKNALVAFETSCIHFRHNPDPDSPPTGSFTSISTFVPAIQ